MSKFITDNITGYFHEDGIRFRLTKDIVFKSDVNPLAFGYSDSNLELDLESKENRLIRVPKNFVTDFASVPQIVQNIFPRIGLYSKAAIVHDWLYHNHPAGRKWADYIFLEAMKTSGVNLFTRYTLYYMVRMFGRNSYDNDTGYFNDKGWN